LAKNFHSTETIFLVSFSVSVQFIAPKNDIYIHYRWEIIE